MSDETLARFTAHELRREDLRALMVRSNGPALVRALTQAQAQSLPTAKREAVGRSSERLARVIALVKDMIYAAVDKPAAK